MKWETPDLKGRIILATSNLKLETIIQYEIHSRN